jgi:hypothetical protein
MRRLLSWIIASAVFGGVALAVTALASDINSLGQNSVSGASPFQAGAAIHKTRADSQAALQFSNPNEMASLVETVSSAPSTRSSFMATWESVPGSRRYLLDVSTSSSFSSYVDGYQDLDVGNVTGRVVTGLDPGTTYYYRVHPYAATGPDSYSQVMTGATTPTTGLNIHATFDTSITSNPNAAAIEAAINRAISILESLFSDPITIQIRFRYATTAPDGTPLPHGAAAQSVAVFYIIPWNDYITALRADATTSNDNSAIASLPGTALSSSILPKSANGRAVGLNTPPALFANGTVGNGGPYDGIVTLNPALPFQFSRPPSASNFDAQRSLEHEIDEVIGLGSRLGQSGNNLRPQDLFSWSSPGVRNISSSGTRYFSINGGVTNIVNFSQNPDGDLGDWLSASCPQAHPYVQNAFVCPGQFSDVGATSPEGINLDVVGYDLENAAPTNVSDDFNNDGHPDYVLYNMGTRRTVVWYMNNNVHFASHNAPTLPSGWSLVGVADFNGNGHPDYLLYNATTHATVIWYLVGPTFVSANHGPTLVSDWQVVGTGDFNGNGKVDLVLYRPSTQQTVVWYLNNNVRVGSAAGPTLLGGWNIVAVADFNRDGHPDYLLFKPSTRQSVIWYLSASVTRTGSRSGPTIPAGYSIVGVADFNGNGSPDYVLYNSTTHQTAIWYLNDNQLIGTAFGPTLPGGWGLAAP